MNCMPRPETENESPISLLLIGLPIIVVTSLNAAIPFLRFHRRFCPAQRTIEVQRGGSVSLLTTYSIHIIHLLDIPPSNRCDFEKAMRSRQESNDFSVNLTGRFPDTPISVEIMMETIWTG